jgi:hypothetical protein
MEVIMTNEKEPFLIVFKDKSILVNEEGKEAVFLEGRPNAKAQVRLQKIEKSLKNGYLEKIIEQIRQSGACPDIEQEHLALVEKLAGAVTSEVGRAIVGISVLMLVVKAIEPEQSIRLHKGGRGDFSWQDGIPMRGLDANYITPVLRKYDLLKLNSFGFMMTRSLAENYPYSAVYKAAIRGAKEEWLTIVDLIEQGKANPYSLLEALISILINHSDKVKDLGEEVVQKTKKYLGTKPGNDKIINKIKQHIKESSYSARLLEVAMHSFFQVLSENKILPGKLSALSQMRSANKKHGNVGDIEVTNPDNKYYVIEAWDAKYGKPYLRDELEELHDKLSNHSEVEVAGFVVDREPEIDDDIDIRISELITLHGVDVKILSFDRWIESQLQRFSGMDLNDITEKWLVAYVESLALKRRDVAPIDEPTDVWLEDLKRIL